MIPYERVGRATTEANANKYMKTKVKMEAKVCNWHNSMQCNQFSKTEEHTSLQMHLHFQVPIWMKETKEEFKNQETIHT
jgi:hypothetical protein